MYNVRALKLIYLVALNIQNPVVEIDRSISTTGFCIFRQNPVVEIDRSISTTGFCIFRATNYVN